MTRSTDRRVSGRQLCRPDGLPIAPERWNDPAGTGIATRMWGKKKRLNHSQRLSAADKQLHSPVVSFFFLFSFSFSFFFWFYCWNFEVTRSEATLPR